MGYKQSWVKSWIDAVPEVEAGAEAAITRLVEAMGRERPEDESEAVEADEERGAALTGLRSALDALCVDFAFRKYDSGEYNMREIAEMLGTNHPTISRWKTEVKEWLAETDYSDDLIDRSDLEAEEEAPTLGEVEAKRREVIRYLQSLQGPEKP